MVGRAAGCRERGTRTPGEVGGQAARGGEGGHGGARRGKEGQGGGGGARTGPPAAGPSQEEVRARRELRRNALKKMIWWVSIGMLFVYVTRFIVSVTITKDGESDRSFTIPFSFGIAYCGLVGSQRMNREILGCFYLCCVTSISLYVINVLLQVRDLALLPESNTSPEKQTRFAEVLCIAIGLETLLVGCQVAGSFWSRELVRDHLTVSDYNSFSNNAFSIDFVQEASQYFENLALNSEDRRLTIASIPVIPYNRVDFVGNTYRPKSKSLATTASSSPPVSAGATEEDSAGAGAGATTPSGRDQTKTVVAVEDVAAEVNGGDGGKQALQLTTSFPALDRKRENCCSSLHHDGCDEEEALCVICQDDFHEGEPVKVLECNHFYHPECLDAWLERTLACPMCMQKIETVTVSHETPQIQASGNANRRPSPTNNVRDYGNTVAMV